MSNFIGIVMGGYLDEQGKLMDRTELNKRIAGLQKENEKLEKQVDILREACEFYADTKDYTNRAYHGVWCGHADDYSEAMGRLIEDDGNKAKAALEKIKEIGE